MTDFSHPIQAWKRVVSIHYVALKYLKGFSYIKFGLWVAARFTFLLKPNFIRPWKWPGELLAFFKGLIMAYKWVKEGPILPFLSHPEQRNLK